MPPERMRICPPASRWARVRSSSTCAITLRAVLAWQMSRTVFSLPLGSALLPRPLPEARPATEILPFLGRTLVDLAPEGGARSRDEIGSERRGEQLHQFGGCEALVAVQSADGLRLGHQRIAEAEGV